jgi:hypothetical protein
MRSELDVLLDKVDDPILRTDIRSQVERLRANRTFGLVFESHLPERVRLPEHPIRIGVKVAHRDNLDSFCRETGENGENGDGSAGGSAGVVCCVSFIQMN